MKFTNRKTLIIVALFSYMLVLLIFNLGNSVMPLFLKQTKYGTSVFGVLTGCMFLGQFLIAPIWGHLSDTHGRKILSLGPLCYGIGQVLYILSSDSFTMLLVSRIFSGIFSILFISQFIAFISDITPSDSRQRVLSLTAIMGPLGAGVAYLIGGLLKSAAFEHFLVSVRGSLSFLGEQLSFQLTQSYTFPFVLQLILGVLMSVYLYFLTYANEQYQSKESNKNKNTFMNILSIKRYQHTIVLPLLAIGFFNSFAYTATQSIQYYLQDALGMEAQSIGVIVFLYSVISVGLSLVIQPILLKKNTPWKNLIIANASVITLAVALGFANVWQLVVLMCFIITMNTLFLSIIQAQIIEHNSNERGLLLGLNQSAISLGAIAGNFVISPLYAMDPTIFQFRLPFVMMAVILCLVTYIIVKPLKNNFVKKRENW